MPGVRILKTVVRKLIAPNNEERPARCNEKIARSTEIPECALMLLNGGYHLYLNR
jgi:hypothetical protein